MNSTTTLMLVIGVTGALACVALIAVGLLWKPRGKSDRPQAQPAVVPAASRPPAPAEAGGPREVLRVLRDVQTEELLVEVAGRRYARMVDVRRAGAHEGLMTTLRDLEAFAGDAPTVPPVVVVPAASAAGTGPLGTTPAAPGGTRPLVAPSMNPFKQMLVLRELSKSDAPAPKSITEQIDEILQEKLAGTPHAERGIRMHNGPKGTALFHLDSQDYDAVDSVPDEAVRALIRAAVAEWEKQQ
jgi:hypothetical protein